MVTAQLPGRPVAQSASMEPEGAAALARAVLEYPSPPWTPPGCDRARDTWNARTATPPSARGASCASSTRSRWRGTHGSRSAPRPGPCGGTGGHGLVARGTPPERPLDPEECAAEISKRSCAGTSRQQFPTRRWPASPHGQWHARGCTGTRSTQHAEGHGTVVQGSGARHQTPEMTQTCLGANPQGTTRTRGMGAKHGLHVAGKRERHISP